MRLILALLMGMLMSCSVVNAERISAAHQFPDSCFRARSTATYTCVNFAVKNGTCPPDNIPANPWPDRGEVSFCDACGCGFVLPSDLGDRF